MNARAMNARTLAILIVATAWPLGGLASEPATVTIDCQQMRLPSQRAVAALLGIDNFSQLYDARARLMVMAGRTCKQLNADRIELVLELGSVTRDRRLVARARR